MAAARGVAQRLAGLGGLYLMHGLGMPDTSALASLRARIDESGFPLVVAQMMPLMLTPSGVPHALAMCLSPQIAALTTWLESTLTEHTGTDGGLLRLPGTEHEGAEAFLQTWIGRIRQLAGQDTDDVPDARPAQQGRAAGSTDEDVTAAGRRAPAGPEQEEVTGRSAPELDVAAWRGTHG
ncbi:hypothetical protein ACFT8W_03035 [Streptomyces hygroscopicus]|uniref:hypothetical protein n=1 Tax=Streptomyces hygroscopicus TaxID=1912 RepID=UPI00362F4A45